MLGIGQFDKVNTRKVCTRPGQVLFNKKKYAQDPSTGYYTCTTGKRRQRLHVAIWEYYNKKEVPEGYVVHHRDFNKTNNNINNLVCVTVEMHNLIHNPPADGVKILDKDIVDMI